MIVGASYSQYRKHEFALDMPKRGSFMYLSGICKRKRAVYGNAKSARTEQASKFRELCAVRKGDAQLCGLLGIGEAQEHW